MNEKRTYGDLKSFPDPLGVYSDSGRCISRERARGRREKGRSSPIQELLKIENGKAEQSKASTRLSGKSKDATHTS